MEPIGRFRQSMVRRRMFRAADGARNSGDKRLVRPGRTNIVVTGWKLLPVIADLPVMPTNPYPRKNCKDLGSGTPSGPNTRKT
jgi:hypothetical protein